MHIWKTFIFPMQKHSFSLMHWINCWKPCFYMHKNLANQNVTFWRNRLPTPRLGKKDAKLSVSHTNCETPFKIILCMLKNNVCKTWKRHEKERGGVMNPLISLYKNMKFNSKHKKYFDFMFLQYENSNHELINFYSKIISSPYKSMQKTFHIVDFQTTFRNPAISYKNMNKLSKWIIYLIIN